jgi:hypothetical protein
MLATAIIGILGGIGAVNYQNSVKRERLKAGTESLAAWLDEIRRLAIQKSESCLIKVNGTTKVFKLTPYNNKTIPCDESMQEYSFREAAQSDTAILCAAELSPLESAPKCTSNTGEFNITFTPRGTSLNNALFQTQLDSATHRCVQLIAPLGLIRVGRIIGSRCNWNTSQ